jgi:VCBS repeat protein
MHLPPALVDGLWNLAAPASPASKRPALLAACLIWLAASPAPAQTLSIMGISATPNCDAVTGISLSGAGSVSITDGNGTLIASLVGGLFIPFEQPNNNTTWTVSGAISSVITPSTFAPQCAPPSLFVSQGEFDARIMKGGLGAPPSGFYTLTNTGGSAVYLAATPYFPNGIPFIAVGALPTLGPGATSPLTVTPSTQAFSLPPGRYMASINFSNAANLSLIATRQLVLTVVNSVAHDFNGDGFSDLVWRDTNGNLGIWLLQGNGVIATAPAGPVASSWMIAGQRDFNGDTKSDWLSHDTSGNTNVWFLNGTQLNAPVSLGNVPTNWTIIATGDFNGDGKGDILWRDTSGNVGLWLMNGAQITSAAGIGNVPTNWSLVGTGDFNADQITDLLWEDNAGNLAVWFMNGLQVEAAVGVTAVPPQWQVAGTGDFDGNGTTDLLWRDTSGNTAIWLMSAATVTAAVSIGNVPLTWSIAEVGDYNGDGYSDILWRDNAGNNAIWFMNGPRLLQAVPLGNVSVNWTVQSTNAE